MSLRDLLRRGFPAATVAVVALLIGVLGGVAIGGRYQIVSLNWGTVKVDRWTGRAWALERGGWLEIGETAPLPTEVRSRLWTEHARPDPSP